MSSKVPVILKKDDSQRQSRPQAHQPIQPKILTKATSKENEPKPQIQVIKKPPEVPEGPVAPPSMKSCFRIMNPHFQIDQKVFDFLDGENSDFLVVAAVGPKDSGKSSLLNIIAHPDYLKIDKESSSVEFQPKHAVFSTAGVGLNAEGMTIDFFATTDRVFLLDCSPVHMQRKKSDMIVAECDDIKMIQMLLQVCHLVLVINDGFPDLAVNRLITLAEQMIPTHMKHRPLIAHIANRVQPGSKFMQFDERVQEDQSILVPELTHPGLALHHDVDDIVQKFQERVFMMKRWSMDESEEAFTEKKWGQRLNNVIDQIKSNDYFIRKYEGLRDKFHQSIEN